MKFLLAAVGDLAIQEPLDPPERVVLWSDPEPVVQVQAVALELVVDGSTVRACRVTIPSRVQPALPMTVPLMPEGTRSEVSLTSLSPSRRRSRAAVRGELGFLGRDLAHQRIACVDSWR
ncbi:MAG: hypothetical protein R3E48_10535 [Burkholderiaceae bacterium]